MNLCALQIFLNDGESNERRCGTSDFLKIRNCSSENIINPKAKISIKKNNDLNSDIKNVVQLKPQNIKVQLRVGEGKNYLYHKVHHTIQYQCFKYRNKKIVNSNAFLKDSYGC